MAKYAVRRDGYLKNARRFPLRGRFGMGGPWRYTPILLGMFIARADRPREIRAGISEAGCKGEGPVAAVIVRRSGGKNEGKEALGNLKAGKAKIAGLAGGPAAGCPWEDPCADYDRSYDGDSQNRGGGGTRRDR